MIGPAKHMEPGTLVVASNKRRHGWPGVDFDDKLTHIVRRMLGSAVDISPVSVGIVLQSFDVNEDVIFLLKLRWFSLSQEFFGSCLTH